MPRSPKPRRLRDPGSRFKRDFRRLDPRLKATLESVLDDLVAGKQMPIGRRHKKMKGFDDQYSVRLSSHVGFVYLLLPDDSILPYAVGPHDEAYDV